MNANDLLPSTSKEVPGVNLDHKNLCIHFISCLYSFPSCFTILHSLPALQYNCHFSYITPQMVPQFLVSFILLFCFFSIISHLFLACLLWEILLGGHLEYSSFCQRQVWQFQSLLNSCNKWLRISPM